jgi:bifunctional non-homologous end joining protein LigD
VTEAGPGDRLGRFRAKRDFTQTPEPAGGGDAAAAPAAPRFVIHEHSARRLHWDLRLERDGVLASWALPRGLPEQPKVNHIAPHTEDHPLEYLDFEGEIPAGSYGAGTMAIWDRGTYECLKWEPRKVEVALHGERVDARYALFAIGKEAQPKDWMIHRMDPAADPAREPMPERIVPMLARAGELPADDGAWAYEVKWDGVRAIAYSEPGRLRFESRNLNEIGASYPELARLNRALRSHSAVLDGEIVAFDADGRPSFGALQSRMHVSSPARARRLAQDTPVTYVIFDILWLDGHSLMGRSYDERRAALESLALAGERWQTPAALRGGGRAVLAASAAARLEGVIAKRRNSTYDPGRRSGVWIKLKNVVREELAIGGWLRGEGGRRDRIGALLVGTPGADGALRYAGRVGTGFTDRMLDELAARLEPLARERSPFAPDGTQPPRQAHFSEPVLIAEVEFLERTKDGLLRAPSFQGLREDRAAEALVLGERRGTKVAARAGGRELALSNLDKVLYPAAGFTKLQVIEYYAQVAPVLLGHLAGRPLTVTRYPDGVDGKAFFEKQSPAHRPEWVRTIAVASERRKRIDFTEVADLPTLIWLANLAALELHAPMHRAPALDRPAAVVFDLDPGPPATIIECCRVALWLAGAFEQLGLASFPKTSGSKGLQVYVPLAPGATDYERTKTFAQGVAQLVEQAEPGLAVSRMSKALRAGKVLIDYSQNDKHKTTVSVYSLRARARPTVSTPVEWDELRAALGAGDPARLSFEADEVLARVAERGDLFGSVLSVAQTLPPL